MPERIQRKRTKGWRMPLNTVYVGRGTFWGNSFRVGQPYIRERMEAGGGVKCGWVDSPRTAVSLYQRFLRLRVRIEAPIDLRGKNLACWCPLDQACHADVLLKLANL